MVKNQLKFVVQLVNFLTKQNGISIQTVARMHKFNDSFRSLSLAHINQLSVKLNEVKLA